MCVMYTMYMCVCVYVLTMQVMCVCARFCLQFSRFLQSMAEQGVVKVEETGKGVESITGIDFKHELVKGFSPSLLVMPEQGNHSTSAATSVTRKASFEYLYMCLLHRKPLNSVALCKTINNTSSSYMINMTR